MRFVDASTSTSLASARPSKEAQELVTPFSLVYIYCIRFHKDKINMTDTRTRLKCLVSIPMHKNIERDIFAAFEVQHNKQ